MFGAVLGGLVGAMFGAKAKTWWDKRATQIPAKDLHKERTAQNLLDGVKVAGDVVIDTTLSVAEVNAQAAVTKAAAPASAAKAVK